MRLTVTYIDLHNPLFLCGMNLGNKVFPQQKGIRWEYDVKEKIFYVKWKGQVHLLDSSIMAHCQVIDNGQLFEEIQTDNTTSGMPSIARSKRNQQQFSPAAQAAREASAAGFKPEVNVSSNETALINQNKSILAGNKAGEGVKLSGKPKVLSHSEIKLDPLNLEE